MGPVLIGTSGWSYPRLPGAQRPDHGTSLAAYARRFGAVELNTTFYRVHGPEAFARWRDQVPPDFRFAVKVPRLFSHFRRLGPDPRLAPWLEAVRTLGPKLGPLLVQLPPTQAFDPERTRAFLEAVRGRHEGPLAWEPRHPGWFAPEAGALLEAFQAARAAADPAPAPGAGEPGGWPGLTYVRLHGSPRMYRSPYAPAFLEDLAARLERRAGEAWVMFDNTDEGWAWEDAEALQALMGVRA